MHEQFLEAMFKATYIYVLLVLGVNLTIAQDLNGTWYLRDTGNGKHLDQEI